MKFSKDKVSDVMAVLTVMRKEFERTSNYCDFTELRKKAVKDVAETEFNKGRFEHEDSAEKSILDACARRLRPDIGYIRDFDRLTERWLRKNSMKLKDILLRHSKSRSQRAEVTRFFGFPDIEATLPVVWEEIINEPNEKLVDLLIEETERKCGVKPSEQEVKGFITKITRSVEPLPVRPTRQQSSDNKRNGTEREYIKDFRRQLNNPDNLISKIKRYIDNIGSIKRKKLKEVCVRKFGCKSENSGSINASIRVLMVDGYVTINGRGDSAMIYSVQN